ncbi:Phage gp6-like head-tail connector protein [Kaistia soli DSM 19436]|uniref:Phage gp6-like head-tail connector protein n=1 Tax=Kaistia soli DSM 19436 TaxID=1122133 RepID=A0A1M5PQ48_9HYPH|nr:head-tail connector protein [Kaistia soli]SHH03811.1 Phage gp6-like head-tail connector protein [Kaistia soli DSM 19436]
MPVITVEDAKSFLRIEGDEDDAVLLSMIAAAEAYALRYTGPIFAEDGEIPEDFKHAVRMLVGHFNTNREAVLVGANAAEIPLGARDLLREMRNRTVG